MNARPARLRRAPGLLARAVERARSTRTGRYGFAICLSLVSLWVRAAIGPSIQIAEVPFILSVLTVAVAAWFGGWAPGSLHALLLIGLTQVLLVVPDRGWSYVLSDTQIIRMSLFALQCVFLSLIIDRLVQSRREVQFRIAHQYLDIALRDAMLRSTGTVAGDADTARDLLRAFVRELGCEGGIAWLRKGGSFAPLATTCRSELEPTEAPPTVRDLQRQARVEALIAARTSALLLPADIVVRCADTRRPQQACERGIDRLVRHVLTVPVADDDEGAVQQVLVFELRSSVSHTPTPDALRLFETVSHDIEQTRRLRSSERAVDALTERLLDRAQELETIFDAAPIGLVVARGESFDDLRVNASAAICLGLAPDTRRLVRDGANPSLATAVQLCAGPMRTAMDLKSAFGPVEIAIDGADGETRILYASASPLVDARGDVRGCVAGLVDITHLRRAELAIRERERAFRRSFECAGVGKAQIDPVNGRFELVNRRLCDMFRAEASELVGRAFVDLLAPHERERAGAMLRGVLSGPEGAMTEEFQFDTSSGSALFGATSITADFDECGRATHLIAVIQDVTDRRHAEAELTRYRSRLEDLVHARTAALEESHRQLRISERMAALGTMSAGLGHDMGNLLLPVRLRLEAMALKGIPPNLQDDVHAIGKCAEYLQRLANGLRLLSLDPDQAHASEHTDLERWWMDIESFLKNTLPHGAELEKQIEPNLPPLAVSRHRLTQAVFNLVQNAADALRDQGNGRVCISATRCAGSPAVCVSVEDNGAGMTPEVRARCLEPFFTSKSRGISTGLGLSLVHGIVQQAGGSVQIESAVGRGTTFRLTFPIDDQPAPAVAVQREPPRVRLVSTFRDLRLRAFAATTGRSAGCDVDEIAVERLHELALCDESRPVVWVADAEDVTPDRVDQIRCGDGAVRRMAYGFGPTPDSPVESESVAYVLQSAPSVIRRVVRGAVTSISTCEGTVEARVPE